MKRWHAVLVALVLFLMGLVVPAEGAEPPEGAAVTEWKSGEVVERTVNGTSDRVIVIQGYNILGQHLLSFSLSRSWSWNNIKVTDAPGPHPRGNVTQWGHVYGWGYEGIITKEGRWEYCNFQAHGCHYQYRQGRFSNPYGFSVTPWVWIRAKWNGTAENGKGGA